MVGKEAPRAYTCVVRVVVRIPVSPTYYYYHSLLFYTGFHSASRQQQQQRRERKCSAKNGHFLCVRIPVVVDRCAGRWTLFAICYWNYYFLVLEEID